MKKLKRKKYIKIPLISSTSVAGERPRTMPICLFENVKLAIEKGLKYQEVDNNIIKLAKTKNLQKKTDK